MSASLLEKFSIGRDISCSGGIVGKPEVMRYPRRVASGVPNACDSLKRILEATDRCSDAVLFLVHANPYQGYQRRHAHRKERDDLQSRETICCEVTNREK